MGDHSQESLQRRPFAVRRGHLVLGSIVTPCSVPTTLGEVTQSALPHVVSDHVTALPRLKASLWAFPSQSEANVSAVLWLPRAKPCRVQPLETSLSSSWILPPNPLHFTHTHSPPTMQIAFAFCYFPQPGRHFPQIFMGLLLPIHLASAQLPPPLRGPPTSSVLCITEMNNEPR